MRRVAWFVGAVTLLATGGYVFVYLYRWEWHRAVFVAVVFVATEMAMATSLVLARLARLPAAAGAAAVEASAAAPGGDAAEGPAPGGRPAADPAVLGHIRASAPRRDHFAWLAGDLHRTSVFVTILLGGGAIVSGGAWLLDRLAGHTARPVMEEGLARQLDGLAFPPGGLLVDDAELVATEEQPDDDPLRLLAGPTVGHR